MRKVRIQRTRKPFLHTATKKNFALGRFCTVLLGMFATYGGNKERERVEIIKAQRLVVDTELKVIRQSLAVEQTRRQELLNAQTRLKLESTFGYEAVARVLGEPIPEGMQFTAENYELGDFNA